jgi:hypothetical protein
LRRFGSVGYFVDAVFDQIAGAKLAIYRQIKECKVAPHDSFLRRHSEIELAQQNKIALELKRSDNTRSR